MAIAGLIPCDYCSTNHSWLCFNRTELWEILWSPFGNSSHLEGVLLLLTPLTSYSMHLILCFLLRWACKRKLRPFLSFPLLPRNQLAQRKQGSLMIGFRLGTRAFLNSMQKPACLQIQATCSNNNFSQIQIFLPPYFLLFYLLKWLTIQAGL